MSKERREVMPVLPKCPACPNGEYADPRWWYRGVMMCDGCCPADDGSTTPEWKAEIDKRIDEHLKAIPRPGAPKPTELDELRAENERLKTRFKSAEHAVEIWDACGHDVKHVVERCAAADRALISANQAAMRDYAASEEWKALYSKAKRLLERKDAELAEMNEKLWMWANVVDFEYKPDELHKPIDIVILKIIEQATRSDKVLWGREMRVGHELKEFEDLIRGDERAVVHASIVDDLQAIVRNDKTHYDHHDRREWDGLAPGESIFGGSIWLSPREIARSILTVIGAEIPQSIEETVSGKFKKKEP